MKKQNKIGKSNFTTFEELLEKEYGRRGTQKREEYEAGFEAFKLGVILLQLRKERGLTQKQLAEKCGLSKSIISRVENDASNIRLSILMTEDKKFI